MPRQPALKPNPGRNKVRGDYYTDPKVLLRQKKLAEALGMTWNAWADMHLRAALAEGEKR